MYVVIDVSCIECATDIARQYNASITYELMNLDNNIYAVVQSSSIAAMIIIEKEFGVDGNRL